MPPHDVIRVDGEAYAVWCGLPAPQRGQAIPAWGRATAVVATQAIAIDAVGESEIARAGIPGSTAAELAIGRVASDSLSDVHHRRQDRLPAAVRNGKGEWIALRQNGEWMLGTAPGMAVDATVELDEDRAWRLFTKGISKEDARKSARIEGDAALAERALDTVSILA